MSENVLQQPLILTARMDEASFAFFDELRRRHFPVERNFLAAHLTLFHHLPPEKLTEISNELDRIACDARPIELRFAGWRSLGRGVAMNVESPSLAAVRSLVATPWADALTPQDRQPFRPHITVQNKVNSDTAKDLLRTLNDQNHPAEGRATALDLWRYLGGPWQHVTGHEFATF